MTRCTGCKRRLLYPEEIRLNFDRSLKEGLLQAPTFVIEILFGAIVLCEAIGSHAPSHH